MVRVGWGEGRGRKKKKALAGGENGGACCLFCPRRSPSLSHTLTQHPAIEFERPFQVLHQQADVVQAGKGGAAWDACVCGGAGAEMSVGGRATW